MDKVENTRGIWGFITNSLVLGGMGVLIGGFLLVRGLMADLPIAYAVLGALIGFIMAGIGAVFVLIVQAISEAREARRSEREQSHFRDNAKENIGIMLLTAKAQSAQNAMLMRQINQQPTLPPGAAPPEMIDYDPTIFELTDGETE